ncbi:SDR family oxidoreductase, partial [Alteromonas abrolhosensis]
MSTSATDKKVIAITGASSGIGEETAKQLVNNGFNVALLARSEDKLRALVEELGNDNAFAVKADVSDFNELDKAFKQVSEYFGRIDGIFANAGRGAKAAGIEKGDVD